MLEVKATGQERHGHRKWQTCQRAVAAYTSEAFTRWLHHQYAPIKLPLAWRGQIVSMHDMSFSLKN